jgi:cyclopropane fatty-acyl-phospholipid synthase-like methyltransferase
MSTIATNRYARDWNGYSEQWSRHYGSRYAHLGDEWCDDGTAERAWEMRLFAHSVEPWINAASNVLEIGPGGGKWTVRLAPRCGALTVFDVADQMLARTKARVDALGLGNVSFVLGNGRDLQPIASASQDVVFSYDVFVHIALEDTFAYVQEIARVLKEGGVAIVHHATSDTRAAWDRIESHNDWYRGGDNTLGQYYYLGRDAIDRMYARAGLRVASSWTDYCTTVVTVHKTLQSTAHRLEQALRDAATATDAASLEAAARTLEALGQDLSTGVSQMAGALREARPGSQRHDVIQRIRTFVRG